MVGFLLVRKSDPHAVSSRRGTILVGQRFPRGLANPLGI